VFSQPAWVWGGNREVCLVTKTQRRGVADASLTLTHDTGGEATRAAAIKRGLVRQIERAMAVNHITKAEMARRMRTSRSQLDRLLASERHSMTLEILARAALAVGRRVKVQLIE
jgi:antitoxin HicB